MTPVARLRKSLSNLEKEYKRRRDSGEQSVELDNMKKLLETSKKILAEAAEHLPRS